MDRTVEEIEDLRLKELEKQAALHGPLTDPSILIEIQELKNRQNKITRKQFVNQLDYDFLMNVVSATLLRFNQLAASVDDDKKKRYLRQVIHDIWMITITIMIFLLLLVVVYKR